MSKAHTEFEKKEFDVKNIELDVQDLEDPNSKVNKVEIYPVADNIEVITHNPKKDVEVSKTVDGAKYKTTEEVQKTRGELPQFIEELIQVLNEQDSVTVQGSFHNWNQAEDEEEDSNNNLFFITERHFDDWVVAPHSMEEDQDEGEEESGEVIK